MRSASAFKGAKVMARMMAQSAGLLLIVRPCPDTTIITTTTIPNSSETQLRVRALETVLTEKGYVDPAALDLLIET